MVAAENTKKIFEGRNKGIDIKLGFKHNKTRSSAFVILNIEVVPYSNL